MYKFQFKDRYNKTVGEEFELDGTCIANVIKKLKIKIKEIIIPEKAVKVWLCYNDSRQLTINIVDFKL